MIPIRCFTCNMLVAHKWQHFQNMKDGNGMYGPLLDSIGIKRVCCRRMLLAHIDTIDDLIQYSQVDEVMDESGTVFLCEVKGTRTISCQ